MRLKLNVKGHFLFSFLRYNVKTMKMHVVILILCVLPSAFGMLIHRPWTEQHWCESVKNPKWPFAYAKKANQQIEVKGRVNSNLQDMRHECTFRGGRSKCHRCEQIACGPNKKQKCEFQIQGVAWEYLAKNIPTVTDVPWAVNGKHRYDYGGGTHVCVFTSGEKCVKPFATDYSQCAIRCWGYKTGQLKYHQHQGNVAVNSTDAWSYPKKYHSIESQTPQGRVGTLAGSGQYGFLDGNALLSKFANPQDVAADADGNVYVADTDNHRIRKISANTKIVSTIAGTGIEGFKDGPVTDAQLSYPSGVAIGYDSKSTVVIYIADTGNHRIRKLQNGHLYCIGGRCGNGTESETLSHETASPQSGLADGNKDISRYNSPQGIAVDLDSKILYVADTGNHIIRSIDSNGETKTIAGRVRVAETTPGCLSPCLAGVSGISDGNLTHAYFNSPSDIEIGTNSTLLVSDSNRLRRIFYRPTLLDGIISSNRVTTVAGSFIRDEIDGKNENARFNQPTGIAQSKDGDIFMSSSISCRISRISVAKKVAKPITCKTRLNDIWVPSGCSSYNQPVDSKNLKASSLLGNIHYNFGTHRFHDSVLGNNPKGRLLKKCVGFPPIDKITTGDYSVPLEIKDAYNVSTGAIIEDMEFHSTIRVNCPSNCSMGQSHDVFGSNFYSSSSSICFAAIHAEILKNNSGGMLEITLQRGIFYENSSYSSGSLRNGVTSKDIANSEIGGRLFSITKYKVETTESQMIAGHPSELLSSSCGYKDSQPPQESRFRSPAGLAVSTNANLSNSNFLYVADSKNNRIRTITATCSKICENGGYCISSETCKCLTGWKGDDCTTPVCSNACGSRKVCVAPNTCSCIPGYKGSSCDQPTCVQSCENNGKCSAPDTCSCSTGWFDSNCTTPVCGQTCGNGGNCTAPSTCSCPMEWKGIDCREPVCKQQCKNGGSCVAPNTCLCPAGWSGWECQIPVCTQGFFIPNPSTNKYALSRPFKWEKYVPCNYEKWCKTTNGFDCSQSNREYSRVNIPYGPAGRFITGKQLAPKECFIIELHKLALTHFLMVNEKNETTEYARYSKNHQYGWNASGYPWKAYLSKTKGKTFPFTYENDRQTALVEKLNVVQGVYACANMGNCTAPGVCECAEGWIGFDCRTPVCSQGYYNPKQTSFVAVTPPEAYVRKVTSNPKHKITIENIKQSTVSIQDEITGGKRYFSRNGAYQGGYSCSIRSLTKWENPSFAFEHPNYYSRYMNSESKLSEDGLIYSYWKNMHWPPLYHKTKPLLDDTSYGWKRGGVWIRESSNRWIKGKCLVEFRRICPLKPEKEIDLISNKTGALVVDTDLSFRPRVIFSLEKEKSTSRWSVVGGECIDQVIRGCYNNGTCIAPNTCKCMDGWKGYDCSIPVCKQQCKNNGNCTLPNICTCERGWTGVDCSTPMCAQDCKNGGKCVLPDSCLCRKWASKWRDGRAGGGRPLYRKENGDPQDTGYTGYDCNTPICTQAEAFILNVPQSHKNYEVLRGHGKTGTAECHAERCPYFDQPVISNDGKSFQSGCVHGNPRPNTRSLTTKNMQLALLEDYNDSLNINRVSDSALCGKLVWEEGDYSKKRYIRVNYQNLKRAENENWVEKNATPGEGVYKCFNKGSCISPDVCTCGDGYTGFDCNSPLCRFRRPDGKIVGCQNHAVCVEKDKCRCIKTESVLSTKFNAAPKGMTGWAGTDCSIAICVQGFFDPTCHDATAGSEGCYRCANGGQCVAPDLCQCAPGWEGFDCTKPICKVKATNAIRQQLFTVDEEKVHAFEFDPCGENGGRWEKEVVNGALIGQGNCTLPDLCTCLCRKRYDFTKCETLGELCEKPWTDPFNRQIEPGYMYGTKECVSGFQGVEDSLGRFQSCHLQIFEPSFYRRYTVSFISLLCVGSIVTTFIWYKLRKKYKRKQFLDKAERRRSRKSSENEPLNQGAFGYT